MMKMIQKAVVSLLSTLMLSTLLLAITAAPALSDDYKALQGVKKVKAVFDVSMGSAQAAPVVFWAVRNVYDDQSVRSLPEKPEIAVVFHGPAVKLVSTDRDGFNMKEQEALDKFADMIHQMKQDGVTLEVCNYALKVLGVNPESILPDIDIVGNGFISVVGYQAQGYSVVAIN